MRQTRTCLPERLPLTYHLAILVKAKLAKVFGHGSSRVYMWSGTKLAVVTDKELQDFAKWTAMP